MNTTRDTLDKVIHRVNQSLMEVEHDAAQLDPKKHRLTRIMERGKPTNYRYWAAGKDHHGWTVWFCYCTNRNAAGHYLCWRERRAPKKSRSKFTMKRDQWSAEKLRREASEWAKRRADNTKAKRKKP